MRNLFDQYSQAENRITHALMTALHEDRTLLRSFLKELVGEKPPVDPRHLTVLEQRYPGEEEPSEEELEWRGIPDGWIVAEEHAWCVFIETKVLIKLRGAQIESHRRTAARRGFQSVTAWRLPLARRDLHRMTRCSSNGAPSTPDFAGTG